jgi:hypothetical protein
MKTHTLVLLLQFAGLLHLGLAWAGATMPRAVQLRAHLVALPPFIRRLFLVYFAFVGMVLVGFGALTFFFANEMAAGEPLARALCLLCLVFWTARLFVASFIFDVRPYLRNWFYRIGYQATNLVFVYLVGVYALAVWNGGTL